MENIFYGKLFSTQPNGALVQLKFYRIFHSCTNTLHKVGNKGDILILVSENILLVMVSVGESEILSYRSVICMPCDFSNQMKKKRIYCWFISLIVVYSYTSVVAFGTSHIFEKSIVYCWGFLRWQDCPNCSAGDFQW